MEYRLGAGSYGSACSWPRAAALCSWMACPTGAPAWQRSILMSESAYPLCSPRAASNISSWKQHASFIPSRMAICLLCFSWVAWLILLRSHGRHDRDLAQARTSLAAISLDCMSSSCSFGGVVFDSLQETKFVNTVSRSHPGSTGCLDQTYLEESLRFIGSWVAFVALLGHFSDDLGTVPVEASVWRSYVLLPVICVPLLIPSRYRFTPIQLSDTLEIGAAVAVRIGRASLACSTHMGEQVREFAIHISYLSIPLKAAMGWDILFIFIELRQRR